MKSSDLSPEQARAVAEVTTRQAKYLSRLTWRMEQVGFPKDDPLYAKAMRARDAALALLEFAQELEKENAKPAWMKHMGR